VAASRGRLHILKYLHEKRYAWNSQTTGLTAQGDHYDCLKYAIDNEARKLGSIKIGPRERSTSGRSERTTQLFHLA
jgi:hypothetical protein